MIIDDFQRNGRWIRNIRRADGTRDITRSYSVWMNIKRRCSNKRGDNPTYVNVTLDKYFENFQNFADWHTSQKGYQSKYHIDKDLLIEGNTVYHPDRCVLIPQGLNNFLCLKESERGDCPLGVSVHGNSYVAHIRIDNKSTYLGSFPSKELAFNAYKLRKEQHAREWAERLKRDNDIDQRVVERLLSWRVHISD